MLGCHVLVLWAVVAISAVAAPTAGAIVGGTGAVSDTVASPVAFIKIALSSGTETCSGTLISPTVVMTAAHCVYESGEAGEFLGIARPSHISVLVGSHDASDAATGTAAGVVAVLPQPRYRWDGTRHVHDIALLALDRSMPQTPATLSDQHPGAGTDLLIAGYGRAAPADNAPDGALRVGLIEAAGTSLCRLGSPGFDPSWLFCGAALTDPAVPGGAACYGDSGGPAFAYGGAGANPVVEGVISYGSRADCEFSRSYLVLVSSERGFIDRALATPPQRWAHLRDDPPTAKIKPLRLRVGEPGVVTLRIDDDKSRHSRVVIAFYTHAGKQLSHAFRAVTTGRWTRFKLQPQPQRFTGYVCAQGSDGTDKRSNMQCAPDVIR
jgi:Trypsin